MQLTVIIVSYNVKFYLEQCLYSILAACKNITTEIIVIDNASADRSLAYLQPKFPQVNFIKNEVNTGFAKANNKALLSANGKYILYINPDTILPEDILVNCISFLNDHNEAGAVGVKMLDGNGNFLPESKRSFPSVPASFFKLSGIAGLFPHSAIFNKYALGNLDENTVYEVEVLAGAFLISRKEILLALNGFDEDFFMYGEDIDLSYRIKKAGYRNYYLGNNVIVHFKGESTKNDSAYIRNFYEAMQIFVRKHYSRALSLLIKPAVDIAAFMASSLQKMKKILPAGKKQINKEFILAGDAESVDSAAFILKESGYSYKILTGEWEVIIHTLAEDSVAYNLVFCLNDTGYANCIQFIKNNKNRFAFYWHYKNAECILSGSNATAIPQIYIHM
jgi:GT2 family glycosyltransferase